VPQPQSGLSERHAPTRAGKAVQAKSGSSGNPDFARARSLALTVHVTTESGLQAEVVITVYAAR